MLFDGPPAELPIATLMPGSVPAPRHLRGAMLRWLGDRARWIAPRTIPLTVAALGLVGMLSAAKYAGEWARCENLELGVHTRSSISAPRVIEGSAEIVIRPLGPRDHYLLISVDR